MKKLIIVLLAILTLTACAKNGVDDYETIDGHYVFFDGETYLSLSLASNAVVKNYIEAWSVTTIKPVEIYG